MPRIFGVTIPDNKKILFSLPYLYGIGPTTAAVILKSAGISPDKNASELSGEELGKIQKIIERQYKIEGDLRKEVGSNQKHYKEIGSFSLTAFGAVTFFFFGSSAMVRLSFIR